MRLDTQQMESSHSDCVALETPTTHSDREAGCLSSTNMALRPRRLLQSRWSLVNDGGLEMFVLVSVQKLATAATW